MAVSSSTDAYVFESIDIHTGLPPLKNCWQQLAEQQSSQLPTQSFEYLLAYCRSFLTELDGIQLITCHRGGALVAILPLRFAVRRMRWFSLSVLEFINLPMPIRDILVSPEEDLAAILRHCGEFLYTQHPWHMIHLRAVPAASPLLEIRSNLAIRTHVCGESNAIGVGEGGYLQRELSANFRNYLRRKRKKLERLGTVEIKTSIFIDDLQAAYLGFLDTEAAGWKSVSGGKRAVKLHQDQTEFYRLLIELKSAGHQAHIHVLHLDGVPIASDYCILSKGVVFSLKHGFDEQYRDVAPGHLLRAYTIEYYENVEDVHTLDLVSSWSWHDRWHPTSRPIYDVKIFGRSFLSRALYFVLYSKDFFSRFGLSGKNASEM